MNHQVSTSALRLTAITTVVLVLVAIAAHFIQAAGSPSSTTAGGGLLRQPIANGNGLVGWWKLDGDVTDATGIASVGSQVNSPTVIQGKFGNAFNFTTAIANYLTVPNNSALNISGDITLSAWINPVNGGTDILDKTNGGSTNYRFSLGAQGQLSDFHIGIYSAGGLPPESTGSVKPKSWNHVVITISSGLATYYINGQSSGSASYTLGSTNTNSLILGARQGSTQYSFNGGIDDVRIYNRALSATEVTNLYQGSSPANFDQFTKNYYPLDDNLGSAAATRLHQTGTSNNGTLTNSPTWTTGKYGNALTFNGSTNYVSVPNNSALNITGSTVTLAGWINPSAYPSGATSASIVGKGGYDTHTGFDLVLYNIGVGGIASMTISTGGSSQALSAQIPLNSWTYVVGTYNGSNIKIYINGALVATNSSVSGNIVSSSAYAVQMGWRNPANNYVGYFTGAEDDIRIYNTALSSSDVSDLYNGKSLASQRSALVGYWGFDEGTGTTAYDHANDNSALLAPGGSTWTSGNFGSAVSLTAASFGSLSIPDEAMTSGSIEFWINPTTITGDQRLLSQASGASTQAGQLALNQSSGESGSLWVWDGSAWQRLADTGTIGVGVWNHIVVDYSGASATAFINGVQTYTVTTTLAFNGVPLSFGGLFLNTAGGYFNGLVDDLRFSSRILQDYEVADHYRLGV